MTRERIFQRLLWTKEEARTVDEKLYFNRDPQPASNLDEKFLTYIASTYRLTSCIKAPAGAAGCAESLGPTSLSGKQDQVHQALAKLYHILEPKSCNEPPLRVINRHGLILKTSNVSVENSSLIHRIERVWLLFRRSYFRRNIKQPTSRPGKDRMFPGTIFDTIFGSEKGFTLG